VPYAYEAYWAGLDCRSPNLTEQTYPPSSILSTMNTSDFLAANANIHGSDTLQGAMVFLALDRPLDQAIRHALALGPYHPGQPSPWSHCFLLVAPYTDDSTAILDCTIRDANNAIIWNSTLAEDIQVLSSGFAGRAGGIYSGRVDDYDNPQVTACGLKWLPTLSASQRTDLVFSGQALQQQGYRYDLPGLVWELIRLLTGAVVRPPNQKLLFCSAFLATVYRNALAANCDFAPNTASADITPDEIWYSPLGVEQEA
jgi:hypothetical protein